MTEYVGGAPMVLDAGALLDVERMRNGPLEVWWNQDAWIEPNRPMPCTFAVPRKSLRARLVRAKPYALEIRIEPPPDEDLNEWGIAVARRLEVPWGKPQKGDKAVWIPGGVWARHAAGAIGSASFIFKRLDGFKIGRAQVRATRLNQHSRLRSNAAPDDGVASTSERTRSRPDRPEGGG